jgi:hypothetical protein
MFPKRTSCSEKKAQAMKPLQHSDNYMHGRFNNTQQDIPPTQAS